MLSRDDAVAKNAARSWCPKLPTNPTSALRGKELARYALCARLWGQSADAVRARLGKRCLHSSSVEFDEKGQERYPYPWQFCYHSGIECDSDEIRDFCGDWMDELLKSEPPFRFQAETVAAPK